MNKTFRTFVDRSMDTTLTLLQFHQCTLDVQKTIPVKKKCVLSTLLRYELILQTRLLSELICYLDVLKHIGVVANLSQLHNSVHQCLCTTFAL